MSNLVSSYISLIVFKTDQDDLVGEFSPANAEAAQLYRENMKEYVRRVKVSDCPDVP